MKKYIFAFFLTTVFVFGIFVIPAPGQKVSAQVVCDYTQNPECPEPADLSITITDSPDPVNTNGAITYIVTATNNGPGDAAHEDILVTLPAGTTFVSSSYTWQGAYGSCSILSCDLNALLVGGNVTFTIVVNAPATASVLTASATISSPDQNDLNESNNTAFATTTMITPAIPPIVDIINPLNQSVITSTTPIMIDGTAGDDTGLLNVKLTVNGIPTPINTICTTPASTDCTWVTQSPVTLPVAGGPVTITATATDTSFLTASDTHVINYVPITVIGGTSTCVVVGNNLVCTITIGNLTFVVTIPVTTTGPIVISTNSQTSSSNGNSSIQVSGAILPPNTTKSLTTPRPNGGNVKICIQDIPNAAFLQTLANCTSPAIQYTVTSNGTFTLPAPNSNLTVTVTATDITVSGLTNSVIEVYPDTDGDGFVDDEDSCPVVVGTHQGCPFGITGNVVLQKVFKGGTPTSRTTTDATIKIFNKDIKGIPAANRYADTFLNETTALSSTCIANTICGVASNGNYYAIAQYTNPAGVNVYDMKQVKFAGDLGVADLLFINTYDANGTFLQSAGTNLKQLFGSLLNIYEPAEVVVTGVTAYATFVYETADNYWDIVASYVPPAGCTVDQAEQTVHVDQSMDAVIFTLTCDTSVLARASVGLSAASLNANQEANVSTISHKASDCSKKGNSCVAKNLSSKISARKAEQAERKENKKSASLWGTVKARLGNASKNTIMAAVIQVAQKNNIAIPEWGINGSRNSRSLSASALNALNW